MSGVTGDLRSVVESWATRGSHCMYPQLSLDSQALLADMNRGVVKEITEFNVTVLRQWEKGKQTDLKSFLSPIVSPEIVQELILRAQLVRVVQPRIKWHMNYPYEGTAILTEDGSVLTGNMHKEEYSMISSLDNAIATIPHPPEKVNILAIVQIADRTIDLPNPFLEDRMRGRSNVFLKDRKIQLKPQSDDMQIFLATCYGRIFAASTLGNFSSFYQ